MLQQARPLVANPSAQPGRGRSFPRLSLSSTSPSISSTERSRQRSVRSHRSLKNHSTVGHEGGQQAERMGSNRAQESRVQAWLGAGQLRQGLVGAGFLAGTVWSAWFPLCKSLILWTISSYAYRNASPSTAARLKAKAHPDRLTPGGAGEPLHPLLSPHGRSRTP